MIKNSGCKKNSIKRKAYSRKLSSGKTVHVKASCIKAQSQSGLKRSVKDAKTMKMKEKQHDIARDIFGEPSCAPGEILRSGYYKKGYKRNSYKRTDGTSVGTSKVNDTIVPPACIKSRTGKSEKGKQLFVLEKGTLSRFGYDDVKNLSVAQRHNALKKAMAGGIKPLSAFRKLIAVATLNKNINEAESNIFRSDAAWLQTTPEYVNRSSPTNLSRKTSSKKSLSKKSSSKSSKKSSKKASSKKLKKTSKKLKRTNPMDEMDQWGGK